MAEEDSDLEKTESPSQRRLDQAREEGQVARSRELSTFAVLMAGGAGIWLMGSALAQQLISLIRDGLTLDTGLAFHSELLVPRLHELSDGDAAGLFAAAGTDAARRVVLAAAAERLAVHAQAAAAQFQQAQSDYRHRPHVLHQQPDGTGERPLPRRWWWAASVPG